MTIIEAMLLIPPGHHIRIGRENREDPTRGSFAFASLYSEPPEDGWVLGKDVWHKDDRHRDKCGPSITTDEADLEAFEYLTINMIAKQWGTDKQRAEAFAALEAYAVRRANGIT